MKQVDLAQGKTRTLQQQIDMINPYEFDSLDEALPVVRRVLLFRSEVIVSFEGTAASQERMTFSVGSKRYEATLTRKYTKERDGHVRLEKETFSHRELE